MAALESYLWLPDVYAACHLHSLWKHLNWGVKITLRIHSVSSFFFNNSFIAISSFDLIYISPLQKLYFESSIAALHNKSFSQSIFSSRRVTKLDTTSFWIFLFLFYQNIYSTATYWHPTGAILGFKYKDNHTVCGYRPTLSYLVSYH